MRLKAVTRLVPVEKKNPVDEIGCRRPPLLLALLFRRRGRGEEVEVADGAGLSIRSRTDFVAKAASNSSLGTAASFCQSEDCCFEMPSSERVLCSVGSGDRAFLYWLPFAFSIALSNSPALSSRPASGFDNSGLRPRRF